MALIKKYNAGGSFKDYLENRLLSDVSAPKEVYDNIGTIDPENPDSYAGYSDRVKGYISNSYADYQKQQENRRTHKTTFDDVHKRDLDFSDFIKRRHGSLENFFEKVDQHKTKDEAKKFLYNEASELSNIFKKEYGDNPNDNWERADLLQSWSNSLGDGSDYLDRWDNMTSEAKKLGWDFEYFLPSDDQYKERQLAQEQQLKAQEQQNKINTNIQSLIDVGFDPELAANYIRSGYRLSDGKDFEEYGFLDKLREGGYNLITNATNTNNFLVKDGQQVKDYGGWISDDILNKHYGYSYGVGSDGTFKIYKPEEYASNSNVKLWEDYNDEKLELTPENNPNPNHKWYSTSADDFQGNFHKNILGLRDLLGQITRIDTRTGGKEIFNRNKNGKYVDSKGNEVEIPNWVSYVNKGQVKHSLDTYFAKNPNSPFYGIKSKRWEKSSKDIDKAIEEVKGEITRIKDVGGGKLKQKYKTNLANAAKHLLFMIEAAERIKDEKVAGEYWRKLSELEKAVNDGVLKDPETEELVQIMKGVKYNKSGGVLKAQDGSILKQLYDSNVGRSTGKEPTTNQDTSNIKVGTVKHLNKTVSEMDALDAASLAGNIVSVIPGIGIVGGIATTGIDIARGLNKDKWEKEDTLNLLSNLGFTALSAVGLGGARALKVGAQAAKGSGKFAKFAKAAKETVKINPTPFSTQVAKGVAKMGKSAEKSEDIKRLVKLTKGADTIGDVAKAGASADDLRLLQQIAGRRHNWVQSAGISGIKGVGKGIEKVGEVITNPGVGKWVGRGVKAGIGYQGVMGGLNVAQNIAEADGNIFQKIGTGFLNTEQSDVKNILFASGLGINQAKSAFRTHAAKRNIRPIDGSGTKATTTLKIGDQTFELNKTAEKGKALKSLKPKDLKDALSKKESKKLLESLSTKDLAQPEQADAFQTILNSLKPAKEGAKVKVPKVTLTQNKPEGFKYELSEHALDKSGQKSYGWWDNILHKSASKSWDKGLSGIYGKTYKWNNTPVKQTSQPASQPDVSKLRILNNNNKKVLVEKNKFRSDRNKIRNTYRGIDDKSPLLEARTNQIKNMEFSSNKLSKAFKDKYLEVHKNIPDGKLPDKIKYSSLKDKELKTLFRNEAFKILGAWGRNLKTGGIIKANAGVKLNNTLGSRFYPKRTLSPMETFTPQYGMKGISTNPLSPNFGVSSAPDNKYYGISSNISWDNLHSKVSPQPSEVRTGEIEYDKYNPIYHARQADYSQPVKLFGETLSFLTTDSGNKAVNRGRIAALNNGYFRVSGPASMNMKRSGMINTANATMGNTQARNNSKGILGASSDIQTAIANRLYQEDILNRNLNEARLADGQQAHAEYMSQAELDRNVQAGRLDAENKNRMMTAELVKNIGLENSNYDLNKYNNISNYIKGLTKFAEEQPLYKAQRDYHHAMANPNLPRLKKYLLDHEAKKQEAMDSWQKRVSAARSRGDYSLQNSNFEDSAEYKGWKEVYDKHANEYKDLEHKIDLYSKTLNSAYLYNAKNATRPQVTSQQKGGRIPLSEKIALENVRHKNRLKRQTEKEFYKQLLENNKAVQKAMVKVFK